MYLKKSRDISPTPKRYFEFNGLQSHQVFSDQKKDQVYFRFLLIGSPFANLGEDVIGLGIFF